MSYTINVIKNGDMWSTSIAFAFDRSQAVEKIQETKTILVSVDKSGQEYSFSLLNGANVQQSVSLNNLLTTVEGVSIKREHSFLTGRERLQPIIKARKVEKVAGIIRDCIDAIVEEVSRIYEVEIETVDLLVKGFEMDSPATTISLAEYK